MSKKTKIWLIVATSLVVMGLIMFAVVMTVNAWDFSKLSTVKFETNAYVVSEKFDNISICTDTEDIFFELSDDGMCRVVCHETEKSKHSVTVENGTLTVTLIDTREWYEYIGIMAGTPTVTIYLPEAEYGSLIITESTGNVIVPKDFTFSDIEISLNTGDVKAYASALENIKISTSTGDILVASVSANMLDLSVSTGSVTVSDVVCEGDIKICVSTGRATVADAVCKNVISSGDTGDLFLNHVIAKESFFLERDTGDVILDDCDAAELDVKTDTGDVMGSLLTDKVFVIQTDTGRVDVPQTTKGGICQIVTDTGDIKITID